MMRNNNPLPGISRIDSETTHGWFVRIYLPQKKIYHSKLFSDALCGEKEQALQLSKQYQEVYTKAHINEVAPCPNPRIRPRRARKSPTGVLGVRACSSYSNSKKRFRKVFCYRVNWTERNGEQQTANFSIRKYGSDEAAKAAAIAFRRSWEEEAYKWDAKDWAGRNLDRFGFSE